MIAVCLNPAAGAGQPPDLSARLAGWFAARGVDAHIIVLASGAGVAEAVRSAVAHGAEAIVAGGGDGTVNRVAAGLVGSDTPLGVLPLGTLNHFAKDAGIPLDLESAVNVVAARHVIRVDVGDVNDRVFLNNSSIGIYPDLVVARDDLRRQGYRKWVAFVIATARIVRRYRGVTVRIVLDGSTHTARTPFLFIGNNEYQAEGLRMGARTRLDAGRLFVYLAPKVRGRDLPKLWALALLGRAHATHTLEVVATVALQVDKSRPRRLRVALDGEVTVMTTPLNYRVRPLALGVIVPAR